MMFVTCFKKEHPRTNGPVIEIIPNDEDTKSVKSSNEKPNGYTNGGSKYNNLRAVPIKDNTRASLGRSVKSVKTFLCCGCCAHPSVSPSQEDMLEIRSPGIARHNDCPSTAVHSIRSKFTELREDSLEEPPSQIEENIQNKRSRTNPDQKSNRSTSEKSFTSKHFEKIYSISDKVDDVYETICSSSINNAQFFTRNTLNTQEAHCNADSEETNSNGSRHSQFSQKSLKNVENSSIDSNRSTKILRAQKFSFDLPQIHKTGSMRNVNSNKLHETPPTAMPSQIGKNVNETADKSLPGDLNFTDYFQTIVHSPSDNSELSKQATIHRIKENPKSSSAGKNNVSCNNSHQQLIENKPKTAVTKESENYTSINFIEDKISVKENTWFGNPISNANESDAESIDGNQSDRSISSNHLSFGRSLSIESNESFRQVVKLETKATGVEIKDTSRSSLITVIDKTRENTISTLVNVHRMDNITKNSDENNNEKKVEGTKQTFDEIFCSSETLGKNNNGIDLYDEKVLHSNNPIAIAQFYTSNLTEITDKLACRSFFDHIDNEFEHESKNQVISPRIMERTKQQFMPEKCDNFTTEVIKYSDLNRREDDKGEVCETELNDMTQVNKNCRHDEFEEKVSNVRNDRSVEHANQIEDQFYSKHNETMPIKETGSCFTPSSSDCEEEYTENMKEDLDSRSENIGDLQSLYDRYGQELGHTLKRRSFQSEEIIRDDSHSTSDLDNRYELLFYFVCLYVDLILYLDYTKIN